MKSNKKRIFVAIIIIAALIAFFFLAKQIPAEAFKELGLTLPLPLFTFIIAIVDGFNPCTLWVLTFLLTLLVSVSHSRRRIFAVGYTFVFIVFIFYFLVMAAWLNLFLFIGWVDIIRIAVALIALIAGAINCKEYFFFRKGVTLMIQERHKKPLVKSIEHMKDVIKKGSMIGLIGASAFLAISSSIVELICTLGFPVIYTKILAEKVFEYSFAYYAYLLFYNLVFIIPIAVIVTLFGYFFVSKQISKEKMQLIKLVGGLIMILLGIILLVNPELLMLV